MAVQSKSTTGIPIVLLSRGERRSNDKPGKNRDYYHTCYCLSGLSIAQNSLSSQLIVGPQENKVAPIHPLFNVRLDSVRFAKEYFTANT